MNHTLLGYSTNFKALFFNNLEQSLSKWRKKCFGKTKMKVKVNYWAGSTTYKVLRRWNVVSSFYNTYTLHWTFFWHMRISTNCCITACEYSAAIACLKKQNKTLPMRLRNLRYAALLEAKRESTALKRVLVAFIFQIKTTT